MGSLHVPVGEWVGGFEFSNLSWLKPHNVPGTHLTMARPSCVDRIVARQKLFCVHDMRVCGSARACMRAKNCVSLLGDFLKKGAR